MERSAKHGANGEESERSQNLKTVQLQLLFTAGTTGFVLRNSVITSEKAGYLSIWRSMVRLEMR